jgi:hypothetical protein
MVYLIWQCQECKDIVASNSFRHHQMDMCKCGKSGVDLEEYGCRMSGNIFPKTIKKLDYNFWEELRTGLIQQGIIKYLVIEKTFYLEFKDVYYLQKLEDQILKDLIKDYE